MAFITIEIQDHQLQKLQLLAKSHGLSQEELLRASVDAWLNSPKAEFTQAADYIMDKNAELYRRLA
ncbi:MAG: DNA-binding protein [Cyanobacteria bacterium P01_F01_bin.53]